MALKQKTKLPPFKPTGAHSEGITRYLLEKAQTAVASGVTALEADFEYKTFTAENDSLVQNIARDHPGASDDSTKLVRENFNRQRDKFKKWLATAEGYPKTFATKCGLIASGLGGSCSIAAAQVPGNDGAEVDDDDDIFPLDNSKPAAAKKSSPRKKTVEEEVEELVAEVNGWTIADTTGKMQIKTVAIKDVPVKGEVIDTRDLVACQITIPPGAVLSTLKISPTDGNTNCVDVSVDIVPNVSKGKFRIKKKWSKLNLHLAKEMKSGLNIACAADVVAGGNHERESDSFKWDEGLKSTKLPVDPYKIGFRSRPTRPGDSLYECERLETDGADGVAVVPCFLVTAFFFVDAPRQVRETGDLTISTSDDSDDIPRRRKKRGGKRARRGDSSSDSIDDMMDDSDADSDGDRKPAATPKKKTAPLSAIFNFIAFGLFVTGVGGKVSKGMAKGNGNREWQLIL